MGTITRSFANNITTSGVFTSSAFNNASFDNVTSVPSGAITSDDMVLVSSATANASASIEFTSGIDSTYKEYVFYFVNIHPSVDGAAGMFNLSTDGGSNYNVVKTTTAFRDLHNEGDTNSGLAYRTSEDLAQSTADQYLTAAGCGNDNDQCWVGSLQLFNPSSTTYIKHFICRTQLYTHDDYSYQTHMAGYANTTSAINAIKFQFATGNIDAGKILMFGIN
jgi:hypothetical protein